jgi:hypothetical protein
MSVKRRHRAAPVHLHLTVDEVREVALEAPDSVLLGLSLHLPACDVDLGVGVMLQRAIAIIVSCVDKREAPKQCPAVRRHQKSLEAMASRGAPSGLA